MGGRGEDVLSPSPPTNTGFTSGQLCCAGLVATLRPDSRIDWITINTAGTDNTALPACFSPPTFGLVYSGAAMQCSGQRKPDNTSRGMGDCISQGRANLHTGHY